jgi:hypothetical protein
MACGYDAVKAISPSSKWWARSYGFPESASDTIPPKRSLLLAVDVAHSLWPAKLVPRRAAGQGTVADR